MKKFIFLILGIVINSVVFSQSWINNLPNNKSKNELTLFDYRKAFDDYWEPFNVDRGYYMKNGVKKKAGGWKQFNRWAWNMEGQINPQTGEFPIKTAQEVYNEYQKVNPKLKGVKSASWISLGPNSSGGGYAGVGRINCIAFHPSDNNTYWVGIPSGGLWVTTNNGTNWTCLTDDNNVLGVSDIIIPSDYVSSQTIYIATGDRDAWDNRSVGVLKSTDNGATWNSTGINYNLSDYCMVTRLLLDPNSDNTIIAATTNGVYKTTNGGTTWSTQLTSTSFIDMEYKPGDFNTLYGSTESGEIYVSTNGGSIWTQTFTNSSAYRIELAVTAASSAIVYAVAAASDDGLYGVYQSTNSGSNFTEMLSGTTINLLGWESAGNDAGGQGWYDLAIAASPSNANIVFVGGINTWRSTDGGYNWSIINHWWGDGVQAVHADKHMLKYRSNGDLFECNDGGIYYSNDNGINFSDKSNGLVISQMYKLGVSQIVANEVITGLQDNGTKLLSSNNWYDVKGGDGMECLIDYTDVNIQYGTYIYGQISRTTDHWSSSINIEPSGAGAGAWVTPYIIDPSDHNTLYAGYANVWKSINQGDSWTEISSMNSINKLRSMAIASSNTSVIYVADNTNIWKTTNGGSNWTDITNSLPVTYSYIKYITVKSDDENTLWVAMSGYNNDAVYQSINGGGSWTNISTGLPQIPAYTIVQNTQITDEVHLYVGTELGVYFKKGSDNWIEYNTGLPNVKIGEIEIYYDANPANSKLRAATYGRGLWETSIEENIDAIIILTTAITDITSTSATTGGNVTYEGSSSITERGIVWNTSGSPTTSDNKIVHGTVGTGTYSLSITSLSAVTTYYVKAYAINSTDTAYGNELSFTTSCGNETLPFSESFDVSSLPNCWTTQTEGGAVDKWEITATNNAGGSANEAHVTYENINPATSRLITPPLNTVGMSELNLSFNHYFDDYGIGMTIKIQSSTDGTNWSDETWSLASSSNSVVIGPETISTTISGNLNSPNTYIAFVIDGNLYQFDDWYIDDVNIENDTTDIEVTQVYTLGKLPVGYGTPHIISALITNVGNTDLTNKDVTLNITGDNTFSNVQNIASLTAGASTTVYFSGYSPTIEGTQQIEVTVPNDDVLSNNSLTKNITTTLNSYSYAQGVVSDGGVGFGGATGDIVAKFTTAVSDALNQVDVEFTESGADFQIGIWDATGTGGIPGTLLYTSSTQVSTVGNYTLLIDPAISISTGDFYVGVREVGTNHLYFAFQYEEPIRENIFYFTSPTGNTSWTDFAPGNPYRFMIEPKFAVGNDVAALNASSSDGVIGQALDIDVEIINYGSNSQSNIPVYYSVDGGAEVGTLTISGPIAQNETATGVFNNTLAYTPSAYGTYNVDVYTKLVGDQVAENDTITFVINVPPTTTPTATISATPGCSTGTVSVSSDLTGVQTFYLYNSDGTTEIDNSGAIDAIYYDFTGQSNGIYTGKVDKEGNMSNLSSQVTLTNLNNPTAPSSVTATQTEICSGSSTDLSYTGGSGDTFGWYTSSCGGTSVGTGNNFTVLPTTTTTYYGRWENSCGNSNCLDVIVIVNPNPDIPVITQDGNLLYTLSANTYQWYINGTPISGAISQFYTATESGIYQVEITNAYGCTSISDPLSVIISGIKESVAGISLNIYPNPNTGEFVIKMNVTKSSDLQIKLFDVIGQVIYEEKLDKYVGNYQNTIDVSNHAKGVYTLQLITEKGTINKKIEIL